MKTRKSSRSVRAFTLVELMLGVGIIALLSSLAIPGYLAARHYAFRSSFLAELRKTSEAFQLYGAENKRFPDSVGGFQEMPGGMENYMPKNSTWLTSPKIGGYWAWLNSIDPYYDEYDGLIVFNGIDATADQLQEMDAKLDDGNLASGSFRYASAQNTVTYGVK